jgi:hypothetical protein
MYGTGSVDPGRGMIYEEINVSPVTILGVPGKIYRSDKEPW